MVQVSSQTAKETRVEPGAIRRVLVVDDSRLQRRLLGKALQSWGFDVVEAAAGDEALEICRTSPPDLVLSDWMMPGMTGPELCRAFRKLNRDSYGYFILLTSKSEKQDIALGLDAGADDFLTKPVNNAELRARISAGDRILRMERELQSTLNEMQRLYTALDNDLIEAKKLQQSLVAERYRDFGAAEVSLLLQSCGHVGGDLVGMFPVSDSRIGLYGIDVSGHGVSSALMTARLAGYLSATTPDQNMALRQMPSGNYLQRPPAETIAALNQLILDEMDTELYFTMVLADVDLATGRVVMAQAGHPHPSVQRKDGTIEIVGTGGLPVGLIDGAEYQQFEVTMAPGDRLMIHSDGMVECANPAGDLLGDEGLGDMLAGLRQTKGMACLESLVWKLSEFAGDQDFGDDVSAVLLEFKPVPIGP